MKEQVLKIVGGAVLGVVIGWGGNALTMSGRVSAIEQALTRIEHRMDALIDQPRREK